MKNIKRLFSALLVLALLVPMMSVMASAAELENKYDSSKRIIGIPPDQRDAEHTSTNANYCASNLIELQPGDVVCFGPVATNLAYHARTYTPDGAKKDNKITTSDCEIVADIVPGISILKYVVPEGTGSMRFAINQMFGDSFLVTINQEFGKEDYFAAMDKAGVNIDYFRPASYSGEFVNVFPVADTTFAGSVDKKGEEKANADYRTSAIIPVNEGDVIYFAGCALEQGYQLVTYDAAGAPAEEATTLNYVSRFVDFGDGYGICAYKARPGTAGVRIVAPAATYDAGKVFVTVNQPLSLDSYNALMNPAPETTEPETTPAPETTVAPETQAPETQAPETTEPSTPPTTGDSALIFVVISAIAIAGVAVVAKRREN
jgi:hypothetical protein